MATVSITVPNGDVPDVFAAHEAVYRDAAVRIFFANNDESYLAATQLAKAEALLKAGIIILTARYRYSKLTATEPVVT